jgi:predicted ATPase/DNA-binding XRE family transcriptional regulator
MSEIHSFGYWVRRRRKALDLTQEDLADQVGCATVTIRKIELDVRRPSLQIAERLVVCLAIPPAERALFLQVARAERATDRLPAPDTAIDLDAPQIDRVRLPAEIPFVPNELIGRSRELAELQQLLQQPQTRLLTLSGPGGVGKTRLAIAVAQQIQASETSEVRFVSLAAISDPAQVIPAIAQACGLPDIHKTKPLSQIITLFQQQPYLLVLDNFEQLMGAAAQIATLLAATNQLQILATSRALLQVAAERVYPVLPLATGDALIPAAAELFCQRAQLVQPHFQLGSENIATIRAICSKLDGLPLAIELAAARIRLFAPEALLARLDHRLALLVSGARDLPARQQTLRATFDWSYELLSPHDRRLFAQLSVFVGGFTLEAAEAIILVDSQADSLIEPLDHLVAHNLVQRMPPTIAMPRFAMLDSIQEYAAALLQQHTDTSALYQRHASYFLQQAAQIEPQLFGSHQIAWIELLQQERGNLISALEWSFSRERVIGDPIALNGLRLACSLWWYWYLRGHLIEGRAWIERGIALAGSVAPTLLARAINRSAALSFRLGEYQQAVASAEHAQTLCTQPSDLAEAAFAHGVLALAALLQGNVGQAEAHAAAAMPHLQNTWTEAVILIAMGVAARFQGQLERATGELHAALARFRQLGDAWGTATALGELGILTAANYSDWNQAAAYFEESLALSRNLGDQLSIAHALHRLGRVARQQGNYIQALALLHEQFTLFQLVGDKAGMAYALWEAAALEAARNRFDTAARIFGIAEHVRGAINLTLASDQREYETWREHVRHALGDAAFAAAFAAGALLTLEQIETILSE